RVLREVDRALVIVLSSSAGEQVRYSDLFAALSRRALGGLRPAEILHRLGLLDDDRPTQVDAWLERKLTGLLWYPPRRSAPATRSGRRRTAHTATHATDRLELPQCRPADQVVLALRPPAGSRSRRYPRRRQDGVRRYTSPSAQRAAVAVSALHE